MDDHISKPVIKAEVVAILKCDIPAWSQLRAEPAPTHST
jgi:hypothetical protein